MGFLLLDGIKKLVENRTPILYMVCYVFGTDLKFLVQTDKKSDS